MAHAKSTDPNVFILPDLGEGVHEAELIKWRVKPGDTIAEHDILAEMETDKALVEVPSPRAGTIKTLHGTEGEILKVGNALVTYEGGGSAAASPAPEVKPAKGSQNGSHHGKAEAEEASAPAAREDDGTVVGKMSGAIGVSAEPGRCWRRRRCGDWRGTWASTSPAARGRPGRRVTEKDARCGLRRGGPLGPGERRDLPDVRRWTAASRAARGGGSAVGSGAGTEDTG